MSSCELPGGVLGHAPRRRNRRARAPRCQVATQWSSFSISFFTYSLNADMLYEMKRNA
jgi:hypothetical protein